MSMNTVESGHQVPETPENKLARLQEELASAAEQLKSFPDSKILSTKVLYLKSEIEELKNQLGQK